MKNKSKLEQGDLIIEGLKLSYERLIEKKSKITKILLSLVMKKYCYLTQKKLRWKVINKK